MASALELKVIFAAVDRFVRPVKAITGAAGEAAKALRENTARMKELDRTVAQIDAFKKAEKEAAITANTFSKTRREIDALSAAIAKAGVPTKAQAAELANLTRRSEELRAKHQALATTEQAMFEKLKAAGVDTRNLAEQRRNLASASAEAVNRSRQLQAALDAENQKMRRLKAAQADLIKSKELAGKLAVTGAGMMAGGAAVGLPVAKAGKDYAAFETAMLGVARQVDGAKDSVGKMTALYWEMGDAIKALAERPNIGKTANEIAKIVEAGARMGIQGKENLLIYAETTAITATAFDLPVDKIGEDIGKISQLYKVPIKDITALGDTINWLDDNALSKGGDIIDVMKRIAGTADAVKMNFKEAAALGSTFLSLGAAPEVAASASNAMIRELSIADLQSKKFQSGLSMLGLNGKQLQKSMATAPTETIIKVLEKIKALASDKQLEVATRLFGKEYGDDAAKLAANLDEYRRQLALVQDQKARGSMQREADTRGNTIDARAQAAQNVLTNLSTDLGKSLKPALVETLERTLSIVQGVRAWAAENPQLAAGLMSTVKWLALLLTVIGAISTAAGAILIPLATAKFAFTTLGLSGGTIAAALGRIGNAIGFVSGKFITGIMTMGRALLMNPIGLTLTTIAGIAYLIYRNWEPISAFFSNLWAGVSTTTKLAWGELQTWFSGLVDSFTSIGNNIAAGIWKGISNSWSWVKDNVSSLVETLPAAVRNVLGIHSPSRVFAEIGMHTMTGFEQGLAANADGPLATLASLARKLAIAGAAMAIGQPALAMALPDVTRQVTDTHQAAALQPPAAVIRQVVDTYRAIALPSPLAVIRNVFDRLRSGPLPAPAPGERQITDAHQASTLPAPLAVLRNVFDRLQAGPLPAPEAGERQITDAHQASTLPDPLAVLRNVFDRIASAVLPNPLDATRLVSDKHQALSLPEPLAAVRQISDQYQPLEQPQPLGGSRRAAGGQGAEAVQQAGDTYHITIQRAAGESDDDLMRKLESMLERIQQKKQTAARSRLRDLE